MSKKSLPVWCAHCPMSRRGFLAAGCAAACAGAAGLLMPRVARAAGDNTKLTLRVLYSLHAEVQPGPDWPNVGFDFRPVMERFNNGLAQAFPNTEFLPALASGEEDAKRILAEDAGKAIDGYIVYQMNCWNRVVQTMVTSGKPVLYVDFQFAGSGGFLVYTSGFLRQGANNLGFVASSKFEDHIAAVKCFEAVNASGNANDFAALVARVRMDSTAAPGNLPLAEDKLAVASAEDTLAKMKASRILAVRDQETRPDEAYLGIPLSWVTFAEVNAAWEKADKDESKAVADRWEQSASLVEDVSRETLETSAAMYLGMKEVLKKHEANAITMNCLGGFYGGHIHAYPCLGFHELNNEGLIGACECDIRSTATMVTVNAMTGGRPGYISDPVMDTAKRQIIYAHCVASNRPFGPDGAKNDFEILTHSEDRQGASVRSLMPVGYLSTTLEFGPDQKEVLFHQAKIVENDRDDRACRTKICGEPVGDIEKLFTQWDRYGWHRVTTYGDLKEGVFALADAMGYTVLEEA